MFFVIFWTALVRYTWLSNSSRFFFPTISTFGCFWSQWPTSLAVTSGCPTMRCGRLPSRSDVNIQSIWRCCIRNSQDPCHCEAFYASLCAERSCVLEPFGLKRHALKTRNVCVSSTFCAPEIAWITECRDKENGSLLVLNKSACLYCTLCSGSRNHCTYIDIFTNRCRNLWLLTNCHKARCSQHRLDSGVFIRIRARTKLQILDTLGHRHTQQTLGKSYGTSRGHPARNGIFCPWSAAASLGIRWTKNGIRWIWGLETSGCAGVPKLCPNFAWGFFQSVCVCLCLFKGEIHTMVHRYMCTWHSKEKLQKSSKVQFAKARFSQCSDSPHHCREYFQALLDTVGYSDAHRHSPASIRQICYRTQPSRCHGHKEFRHSNQLCPPKNHPVWSM